MNHQISNMLSSKNSATTYTEYLPLQPTVGDEPGSTLRYRRFQPSDIMKPYVSYYWVLWSENMPDSTFTYRVVPDGCNDLIINCNTFEGLLVSGMANTAANIELTAPAEYFGICFSPGCLNLFFPLPLKDLVNNMVPCQDIFGNHLKEFESRLFAARSIRERIDISDSFLTRQLVTNSLSLDSRLRGILKQIYRHHGNLSFEHNVFFGVSPRQLRRLFDRYLGISPKSFARIIRFQSILYAMLHDPKQTWRDLCFDYGYYDQAHFIHEFKNFFGVPPMSAHLPKISGNRNRKKQN